MKKAFMYEELFLPPAMTVPAIVTARHPYLLTKPDEIGPMGSRTIV